MGTTRVATLSSEDQGRFALVQTKYESLQINPAAYSSKESEEIVMNYNKFVGDILRNHEIDETRSWLINVFTGTILYLD